MGGPDEQMPAWTQARTQARTQAGAWPSQRKGLALAPYRASDASLDALDAAKSWSKAALALARRAASLLVARRVDEALPLAAGLKARADARPRVPAATREAVGAVHACARALAELARLAAGEATPDYDSAGRALSLRMRWRRVCALVDAHTLWPREAIAAVARRLAEGAVRAQYERAAAMWQETPPRQEAAERQEAERREAAEQTGFEL